MQTCRKAAWAEKGHRGYKEPTGVTKSPFPVGGLMAIDPVASLTVVMDWAVRAVKEGQGGGGAQGVATDAEGGEGGVG